MNLATLETFLMWNTLIHWGILIVWSGTMILASDWLHRVHGSFFPMDKQTFSTIHYSCIAAYKLAIFVFFAVPWIVLAGIL